ncbi:MAG: hypothetical protein Q4G30_02150 [Actinomycetaceae bacterium]|nr:hypothetical protein [Actinomycetaceae bacterium]
MSTVFYALGVLLLLGVLPVGFLLIKTPRNEKLLRLLVGLAAASALALAIAFLTKILN